MSLTRRTPLKRTPGPARKTPMPAATRRLPRTRAAKVPATTDRPAHRATGLQKPVTGERTRRRGWQAGITLLRKTEAKHRDHYRCQFPGCTVAGHERVDAAHLTNSGSGGRFSVSSKRGDFVAVCNGPEGHHNGNRSLHSTHIKVVPRDPELGADGPLDWYARTRRGNVWSAPAHVGTTRAAVIDIARS